MEVCTHKEADTHVILYVYVASQCGYRQVMIRTIDTDVLFLSVSKMQDIDVDELWIAKGTGKHFRYLAIHDIAAQLGPQKAKALSNAACPNRLQHHFHFFWQRQTNSLGYLECLPCSK